MTKLPAAKILSIFYYYYTGYITKIESFWRASCQTNDRTRIKPAYANICAMALMRATVASLLANLELLLTIKSYRDERESPVSLGAILATGGVDFN